MASLSKSFTRVAFVTLFLISFCTFQYLSANRDGQDIRLRPLGFPKAAPNDGPQEPTPIPSPEALTLTESQCREAFPGLTRDIDDNVERGKFRLRRDDAGYKGSVQGRIKDGKLYIISIAPDTTEEVIQERTAILHQILRAVSTSPEPLPNTHFSFCVNDSPKNNSWTFARPNKQSSLNVWLMPHFSFWLWPVPFIGSVADALLRIDRVEKDMGWEKKTDKAVWRGTTWFNPVGNGYLRGKLIEVSKGREWADIEGLKKGKDGNAIPIEGFCKYKYLIYTEGVTYSGRLHYHQACASVLLTPPLTYLTHTSYLLRPILSSVLLNYTPESPIYTYQSRRPALLPTVSSPEEANAIYVSPDWSDLEPVIMYLRGNADVAEAIAKRGRKAAIESGWLSGAAEVCYWRSLIRGWASMAEVDVQDEGWRGELGIPVEDVLVKGWGRKRVGGRRG